MKFRTVVAGLALAASVAAPAAAERPQGLYIAVSGGANFLSDMDFTAPGTTGSVDFEQGWAGLGAVGFHTGFGLRIEAEFGYRYNANDSATTNNVTVPANDDIDAWTGMLNVVYDLDLGLPVVPYLGVGGGVAYVDQTIGTFDGQTFGAAIQGIAGLAMPIMDNLELFVDYRYLRTLGLNLRDKVGGATVDFDDEYESHTVLAGLRFTLAPPPPPPAPPMPAMTPAPEPVMAPRNFLVFFEWDRSDLTADARSVIADAASYAMSGGIARIMVTGHADTSGAADYNIGLSQRRAEAVSGELVTVHQIDPASISTDWRGESEPLVATGDGVREPQNRRVEIMFP